MKTLCKNKFELYKFVAAIAGAPDDYFSVIEKTIAIKRLMVEYHELVKSGKMEEIPTKPYTKDDIDSFKKCMAMMDEYLASGGVPLTENEKGELNVDEQQIINMYLRGEIDFDE